jgi:hypothetical protein
VLPSNAQAKIEDMSRFLLNQVSQKVPLVQGAAGEKTLTAVTQKIAVRQAIALFYYYYYY